MFAEGSLQILDSLMEEQRASVDLPGFRPVTVLNVFGWLVLFAAAAGTVYFQITVGYADAVSWGLIGFLVVICVGSALGIQLSRIEGRPGLTILAAGEPSTDERESSGLLLRWQQWVRKHPLINWIIGFAVGVGMNVVANVLT